MAVATALANPHVVSTILHHLSDMKYRDRRQNGPDEPVEFLEFRPTLVPSILVNRLWADEGTGILWRRYPHLPALRWVSPERRQYYADKVQQVFVMSPPDDSASDLDYLKGLRWPNLKSLEFEVDFLRHGGVFADMLHGGLERLELLGMQSGDSTYISGIVLPELFNSCSGLKSIRIGPDVIADDDPVHVNVLYQLLDTLPALNSIEIKDANFVGKDALFTRLSQRPGLQNLEIDLDPGSDLVSLLSGPDALPSPFASLKRLELMCYPEVALALPTHLHLLEHFKVDIARIPNQPAQASDMEIFNHLLEELTHCPNLRVVKIAIGLLAEDFPSMSSYPKLSGRSLVKFATACPNLYDLSVFTIESSTIDGSDISAVEFDEFCRHLPRLRSLNLRLQPTTATALETMALSSLSSHCPELEVLRLKFVCQLPALPASAITLDTLPDQPADTDHHDAVKELTLLEAESRATTALFPKLTHLALSRPVTALAPTTSTTHTYTTAISSSSPPHSPISPTTFSSDILPTSSPSIPSPTLEESLVHTHATPLTTHFPALEILEAWGDASGLDHESLLYFLPLEEVLATVWEFLSGVEQDLWEGASDVSGEDAVEGGDGQDRVFAGEEEWKEEEGESWYTLNSNRSSGEDWEKACLMEEFVELSIPVPVSSLGYTGLGKEGGVLDSETFVLPTVKEDSLFTEEDILDLVDR
ncbi:unnamed protein product [Periconia digitata]|uniref:Uncharacterized protein n=1 Tax=Periconia digitata TaxID=1303443 RepID=A0A9W4UT30_9PLEO|nr:unnamed protein product [Periconia digitata]